MQVNLGGSLQEAFYCISNPQPHSQISAIRPTARGASSLHFLPIFLPAHTPHPLQLCTNDVEYRRFSLRILLLVMSNINAIHAGAQTERAVCLCRSLFSLLTFGCLSLLQRRFALRLPFGRAAVSTGSEFLIPESRHDADSGARSRFPRSLPPAVPFIFSLSAPTAI